MREKFYRFMQGRYGVDQLYRFIFFLALVLMIINTISSLHKTIKFLSHKISPLFSHNVFYLH